MQWSREMLSLLVGDAKGRPMMCCGSAFGVEIDYCMRGGRGADVDTKRRTNERIDLEILSCDNTRD